MRKIVLLLLIVLFILAGCTSSSKKTSVAETKPQPEQIKATIAQESPVTKQQPREAAKQETSAPPATKEPEKKPIISGVTLSDVLNTFEPLELTFEAPSKDDFNPEEAPMIGWHGTKTIQKGSNNIYVMCFVFGYSESEIWSISLSVDEKLPSANNSQSFEAEASNILSYVYKIPIKGVNNENVGEWAESTLRSLTANGSEKTFAENNVTYHINNYRYGSSKKIFIGGDEGEE